MPQRKFIFMKFENPFFLHFPKLFGERTPVEVQVIGEALAVERDGDGVGSLFGGLRGKIDEDALADRFRSGAEDAVGESEIFLHGDAEHVIAKRGLPGCIGVGGLIEGSEIEEQNHRGFRCRDIYHHRLAAERIRLRKDLPGRDLT